MPEKNPHDTTERVAIIGMSGRFPGAPDLAQFWHNLETGVDSISHFSEDEHEPSRLEAAATRAHPHYVRARGVIEGAETFDASFFGVTPQEATVMDPQHRLFLEASWEALEAAGYDPATYDGAVGVWGGASANTYLVENLLSRPELVASIGPYQTMLASDKDFLTTRVSYKLNLRGPSVNVQTACSTSLVAVCRACQGLLTGECDIALAGGVAVTVPRRRGFLYQPGAIGSPDGRCRPFDSQAAGTVFSDGVGVVVLKRLSEALADGDAICAVIRGAAVNNDGSAKAGFTAPSVEGQAEVIAMAHALAEVEPESISYVEAHGTATPLGDPIEVAALTQAFRAGTSARGFCALGSLKSNIGHLDAAAGVAGLIKTTLALQHRVLPPSLHFEEPNPQIDFADSPFYVNGERRSWKMKSGPRRAGVSSFGIGGTNAHVVLEEAPEPESGEAARDEQLLLVSARTEFALHELMADFARHLREHPDHDLADVAYTRQVGRRKLACCAAVVARSAPEAADCLERPDPKRVLTGTGGRSGAPVAFLFPGQGAQHVGMTAGLYRAERVFRDELDGCAEALTPLLGLDLRSLLFADPPDHDDAERRLAETAVTQPALFAVEYALARQWMSWGVTPAAMLGHSLGEYVAACLAGVLSRDDALALVAARGRLMQECPLGSMLAVRLPAEEVKDNLPPEVTIAGLNSPEFTVVSGPSAAVRDLDGELTDRGVSCRPLSTSHAFHSSMMDGAIAPFREAFTGVTLAPPRVPWISCLTGDWIIPERAVDPDYWGQQLRNPVRFSDGVRRLGEEAHPLLLEVGPGHALSTLVHQHRDRPPEQVMVTSLGPDPASDVQALLEALGRLWMGGATVDWSAVHGGQKRRRVPLPTYPFERKRFWIDPAPPVEPGAGAGTNPDVLPELSSADDEVRDLPATIGGEGNGVERRLMALLTRCSGLTETEIDTSRPFLELGFDSLLLTQVSSAVETDFGVSLGFRQLIDELPTPKLLAAHLESSSPGDVPASTPSSGGNGHGEPRSTPPEPPVPGARLGRAPTGEEAWFIPDPDRPGKYLQVTTR